MDLASVCLSLVYMVFSFFLSHRVFFHLPYVAFSLVNYEKNQNLVQIKALQTKKQFPGVFIFRFTHLSNQKILIFIFSQIFTCTQTAVSFLSQKSYVYFLLVLT